MYVTYICCLLFVHAPLFLSDADILITCAWVMVISGPYICFLFQCLFVIILGYDVPTCGSRVPFVYILCMSLLFLSMMWMVVHWLEFGWCDLYCYLYVCLVVGIGRESAFGVFIRTDCLFLPFGAPSLYSDRVVCCPSNRWTLSVFLQKS